MKAVMLAAGVGARLAGSEVNKSPKILMNIGGKSLLQRHLEILRKHGIDELVIGVGYQHQEIEQKIEELGARATMCGPCTTNILQKAALSHYGPFAMNCVAAARSF